MNTKKNTALVILLILVLSLTACSAKGIDGRWVLTEETDADGTHLRKNDLESMGISEEYVIQGTEVDYKCEIPQASKPIEITFALEELGGGKYKFNMPGGYAFAEVALKGNRFSYDVGEGNNKTTMVFKRQ